MIKKTHLIKYVKSKGTYSISPKYFAELNKILLNEIDKHIYRCSENKRKTLMEKDL